ncbi:hypothetical protein AU381_16520 [Sinorhizobium glycinis]|uniref:Secreted protein n=1 Tax=Sinorhizobium glycinis TaxID=1472378 RepID=A0A178Y631_9HYPH|nr:hypothetical protein [Sinorhizobium glycinis]OAP42804.1 hypothetical protein AU381_16520 [Sinorhizobium glycinis]
MRTLAVLCAAAAMITGTAEAGSQSSNTSSNSSSNNTVVNERIVGTRCEDGYCERRVLRRTYRDGRDGGEGEWRHYYDYDD